MYLEVEWLGHMTPYISYCSCATGHSRKPKKGFQSPHILAILVIFWVLTIAIFEGVKYYLIMVWVCISAVISNAGYLFMD